jgi:hypothetical protein
VTCSSSDEVGDGPSATRCDALGSECVGPPEDVGSNPRLLPAASSCDRGRYQHWFNEDPPAWLQCTWEWGRQRDKLFRRPRADRTGESYQFRPPNRIELRCQSTVAPRISGFQTLAASEPFIGKTISALSFREVEPLQHLRRGAGWRASIQ